MNGFGLSDGTRKALVQWGVTVVVFVFLVASRIIAEMIVPEGLKAQPEHENPIAIIEIKAPEIRFSIRPPYRESREHQAYVQKTLEEWRDRAIERCDGK